ncbi:MAG: hypoxanthine phosphoribosyltransferase [Deltaproteobacteria bacterium]|nr:hypoxanthine phosphoribosyltransferase [Deltaproteobacteria bacterium]
MPTIRTLIDAQAIAYRVKSLGAAISHAHRGHDLVLISVLKGSFVFAADLIRAIEIPVAVDFLACQSYGAGTETSGVVKITHDLTQPIEGKHVIVVEDIIDTGLTMSYLLSNLETRKPASLEVCALLHKPARSRVKVPIHYLGFTIEDVFVVGYGLDFAERYRNLPYIGVLEEER